MNRFRSQGAGKGGKVLRLPLLLLILLLPLLLFILIPLFPMLRLTSNVTHQLLWIEPMSIGEKFTLRFTHSVERTDVDEVLRAGEDSIIIDSTIYESFGAGLPDQAPEGAEMKLENGKLVISHINRSLPFLDVEIGQVVANHRLIYRGQILPLKDLAPPGTSIRIMVKRENILTWLGRSRFYGRSRSE